MQTQHTHTNAIPDDQKTSLRVMKHIVVPPEGVTFILEKPLQLMGVRKVGNKFVAYGMEMNTEVTPKAIHIRWFTNNVYIPPKLRYLGSEAAANDLLHFYYGLVEQFEE